MKNLKTKIASYLSTSTAILLVLIPLYTCISCISTINNEMGGMEKEIRQINRSVQSQKWICDGIEEPVYYRGRKIYNGAFTRYYKYQSAKTGKMYRPKKKPVCQELGERPFTDENLERISFLRSSIKKEHEDLWHYRNLRNLVLWILLFIFFGYLHREEGEEPRF